MTACLVKIALCNATILLLTHRGIRLSNTTTHTTQQTRNGRTCAKVRLDDLLNLTGSEDEDSSLG